MPSHLSAPPSDLALAGLSAGGGGTADASPAVVPAQTRRSRRAVQAAEPARLPGLPAVPEVLTVLLPDAADLVAADGELDDAPLVSPRAGRRSAAPAALPLATAAPAVPAPRAELPVPVAEPVVPFAPAAAVPAPVLAALPRQRTQPVVTRRSTRRAASPPPAAATETAPVPVTVAPADTAPVRVVELLPVDALGDDPVLLAGPVAPAPAPAALEPAPRPMTRRARREVAQLEAALALPSADREGLDAAGSAFVPSRGRRSHRQTARATFGLPQAGMVGVLGIASLVAPIAGQASTATADTGAIPTTTTTELSIVPASALDVIVAEGTVVAEASAVASPAPDGAPVDVDDLLAKRAQAEQASRAFSDRTVAAQAEAARQAEEAAALEALVPGCSGQVSESVLDASNGRLDPGELCQLWESGDMLRADAAVAFAELNLAFRAQFGEDLAITDSYRSYSSQVAVKRKKPGLAARPGTSQHGWGLAVDLGGGVQKGDRRYAWLAENASEFGWENPDWARRGGSGPYEPWHWEFAEGRDGASTGSEDASA